MTTTAEAVRREFLADIRAHPEDDTPRLIYADWLDDYGEHDDRMYANFIRAQIAGKRQAITSEQFRHWFRLWWGMGASFTMSHSKGKTNASIGARGYGRGTPWTLSPRIIVRRGFVAEVCIMASDWLRHPDGGPSIVRQHPLERVTLADKSPSMVPDSRMARFPYVMARFFWYSDPIHIHTLSNCIGSLFQLLPRIQANGGKQTAYETEQDAINDLSTACIAWAKEKAS